VSIGDLIASKTDGDGRDNPRIKSRTALMIVIALGLAGGVYERPKSGRLG